MKKYRIREGSPLWHLKKGWWFIFLCAVVLVAIAFPRPEAEAETTPPAETQPTVAEKETVEYDVPLSPELQAHIKDLCDSYKVDMPLVLAIIGQESNYTPELVGDNGNSIGLMQIQPAHHMARMERLGVTNLLDPYQNVTVGIDLLAELMAKGKGAEWAVTAYNAGAAAADYNMAIGMTSEYTESVLMLREEI